MILKASNLSLTDSQESARLTADIASGSSTLTVDNISGFSVDDYILIGEFGDSNAEILKLHAETDPTGSTITLSSNTTKDHYSDSKVTVIPFNRVEFSRATTLTGAKSVLTTKDISADREETTYTDTNSTGYAFFRFSNPTSGFYSEYSSGASYVEQDDSIIQELIDTACTDALVEIGDKVATESSLLVDINECQKLITTLDWNFELEKEALTASSYENIYSLDSLTYDLKYKGSYQGIKSVRLSGSPLEYIDNSEMEDLQKDFKRTTTTVQAEIGDTSITLSNTYELAESGSIYINGMTLTYTTNTKSTGVLSGISASSITSVITVGSIAWQGVNPGLPTKYTITSDNYIAFNVPISSDYNGYSINIEYLKKLSKISDFTSTIEIPFTEIMPIYVQAKIEKRKRNFDNYKSLMEEFNNLVALKHSIFKLPTLDSLEYYNLYDKQYDTTE